MASNGGSCASYGLLGYYYSNTTMENNQRREISHLNRFPLGALRCNTLILPALSVPILYDYLRLFEEVFYLFYHSLGLVTVWFCL